MKPMLEFFSIGQLSYDVLQWSYSWCEMLDYIYYLIIYIIKREESRFTTTILSYMFLLGLVIEVYNEVIVEIWCLIICTTWWFIFISDKNK